MSLEGRLDAVTHPVFEERLFAGIAGGELEIVLNCGQLNYVSSLGLKVLLKGAKKLAPVKGRIVLVALQPHVHEVLLLAGYESLFASFPTVEAALAAQG